MLQHKTVNFRKPPRSDQSRMGAHGGDTDGAVWEALATLRLAMTRHLDVRAQELEALQLKHRQAQAARRRHLAALPAAAAAPKPSSRYIEDQMRRERRAAGQAADRIPPQRSLPQSLVDPVKLREVHDRVSRMAKSEDAAMKREEDALHRRHAAELLSLERAILGIRDLVLAGVGGLDPGTVSDAWMVNEAQVAPQSWTQVLHLDRTSEDAASEAFNETGTNPFEAHFVFQRERLEALRSMAGDLPSEHMEREAQLLTTLNSQVAGNVWEHLVRADAGSLAGTSAKAESLDARQACGAIRLYLRAALRHLPMLLHEGLQVAHERLTRASQQGDATAAARMERDWTRLSPLVVPAAGSIIRQQLLADEQGLLDKTFLHALGLSTKWQVSCQDLELRLFTALAHILSASRILGLVRSSIGLPHPTEQRGSKHALSGGLSQTPEECDDLASMFTPRMRRVLFTEPSGAALPSGSTDSSNVTAE